MRKQMRKFMTNITKDKLLPIKESLKDNWAFLLHLLPWVNLKHSPVIVSNCFYHLVSFNVRWGQTKKKFIEIKKLLIPLVMKSQNANLWLCNMVYMSLLTEISLMINVKVFFIIVQKQRLPKMIFITYLKSLQNGSVSRICYIIASQNISTENSLCS